MATLEEIYFKEFNRMMYQLKGASGYCDLGSVPLPPTADGKFFIETRDKVFIGDIDDEYYGKLSQSEALLWGTSALKRRKYDFRGEFMQDSNGNPILEDVVCPHDCIAVISKQSIGVPTKYKPKETFEYVDMVQKTLPNGRVLSRFVYIIPRKYCYKINQTALVLSWNKLRSYYSGTSLSLQNGHILYLYIIPYKPTSHIRKSYRVLHTKTSDNYTDEITMLRDYWLENNIMFNPADCQLYEYVRGRENLAYERLDGVLDVYEYFNASKPLGEDEDMFDIDFSEEV